MSDYTDRLTAMEDPFKAAEVRQPFGELPPDGLYQGIIQDFDFLDLRTGLFLKTVVKLVTPDQWDGHEIDQIHALEDPERLDWVKRHLTKMGIDVDSDDFRLGELEGYLPRLLDVPVEIEVKTSERINEKTGANYRNWYVTARLGDPLGGKRPSTTDVPADTEGLEGATVEEARAAAERHQAAKGPTGSTTTRTKAEVEADSQIGF